MLNRSEVIVCLIALVAIVAASVTGCVEQFRFVDGQAAHDCYGNIVPCRDAAFNLGSEERRWHNLYVENIITGGDYANGVFNFYTNGVPGMVKQIIVADGRIIYVEVEP